jgi:hypothetical protein
MVCLQWMGACHHVNLDLGPSVGRENNVRMPDHGHRRLPSSCVERAGRCDTTTSARVSIASLRLRGSGVCRRGLGLTRRWLRRPSLLTGLLVMPEETKREVYGATPGFFRANESWQQGQDAPLRRVTPGNERPAANPWICPLRAKSRGFNQPPLFRSPAD